MEKYNILIVRPWFFTMHWKLLDSKIQRKTVFSNKSKFAIQLRENWRIFFAIAILSSKHAYDMGKISIKLVNKKNSSLWQTAIECMDIMQIVTSKTESSKSKMTALFCQRRLSRGLFYFPELEIQWPKYRQPLTKIKFWTILMLKALKC